MGCAGSILKTNQVANIDDNEPDDEKDDLGAVPPTILAQISRDGSTRSALTQNVIKANQDKDIRDFYDIDHQPVLGSGISGQVKICVHRATKMQYALKSLSKRALPKDKLARMKDEIRCMAHLDHPNILRIHEFFENRDVIYLVLELCRGGELLDRLHQQQGHHYSEKVACKYVHTMLNAIAYCHANNVVHRDLKLENFLFESDKPDSDLKLIDFGLSQYFQPKEVLHNSVGTPYYVAPEVLEGNYDAKCDVWSIGVIAYMLLSGTPPFYGRTDAETLNAVRLGRWQFDEYLFKPVSPEAKDFISKCLIRRPTARPSARAALEHKWFKLLNRTEESHNPASLQIINRLDSYVRRSSLSKIMMDVVAHTLMPEQIADLREQFMKFDISRTGEITMSDLRTVLEGYPGFREEDLNTIFNNLNIDQTGKISYHEFLAATVTRQNIKEENLQIAFERMSNHSDVITADDIKNLLGNAQYDVDKIMEEVGLQPDSKIRFSDFKAIMYGGNTMPTTDSPVRVEMRKVAFWRADSEAKGGDYTPSGRFYTNSVFGASGRHRTASHDKAAGTTVSLYGSTKMHGSPGAAATRKHSLTQATLASQSHPVVSELAEVMGVKDARDAREARDAIQQEGRTVTSPLTATGMRDAEDIMGTSYEESTLPE